MGMWDPTWLKRSVLSMSGTIQPWTKQKAGGEESLVDSVPTTPCSPEQQSSTSSPLASSLGTESSEAVSQLHLSSLNCSIAIVTKLQYTVWIYGNEGENQVKNKWMDTLSKGGCIKKNQIHRFYWIEKEAF